MKNKEKDIVLKGIEKLQKDEQKQYTKNKAKYIINKNYNPLYKGYNSIYEREGLYMEEKKVILEEISKDLKWKDKIFIKIFPKTCIRLYRRGMTDCFNYYNKDGTF